MTTIDPTVMSNMELLSATADAARDERRATAELLALLAEVDARRLYLGEGCSSLFAYCTQVPCLSENAAYHRIEAARAARRHPVIFELVARGDMTLTTVALLRPHMTDENHDALLEAARRKSKRDVEYQIACLAPRPEAKALIRRLPNGQVSSDVLMCGGVGAAANVELTAHSSDAMSILPSHDAAHPARSSAPPTPRSIAVPLASDRYLLRVTLSADVHTKLRRAQDLMRHTIPNGDPAAIVSKALTVLVDHLEKAKTAKTARPRLTSSKRSSESAGSRYISALVRRAVWARDQGRCAFVGPHGRCTETGCLEYHHVIPFARCGTTDESNLSLRCRAHNGLESELVFGRWSPPPEARTRSGPS